MEHNPQHGLASFHTTSALSEFTKTTTLKFILIISQIPRKELIEINYTCMNQMDKEEKRE